MCVRRNSKILQRNKRFWFFSNATQGEDIFEHVSGLIDKVNSYYQL